MQVRKFSGENIKDVIYEVKSELGPEAVIIEKRKVKKGGIFGFFAKTVFEVLAAVEDQKTASPNPDEKNAIKEFIDEIQSIKDLGLEKAQVSEENVEEELENNHSERFKRVLEKYKESGREIIPESDSSQANNSAEQRRYEDFEEKENDKVEINSTERHISSRVFKDEFEEKEAQKNENPTKVKENREHRRQKNDSYRKNQVSEKNSEERNRVSGKNNEENHKQQTAAESIKEAEEFEDNENIKSSRLNRQFKFSQPGTVNDHNQLYNFLLEQGVESRILNKFIKKINENPLTSDNYQEKLKLFLDNYFSESSEIRLDDKQKVISFIGPTGVGKTTTLAKVAAEFALEKDKKVALLTADTYRIAAVEQLRTYSNIIDIPFAVCYSSSKLEHMVKKQFSECDLILIDTPGSSWKNDLQIGQLKAYTDREFIDEVHLLLSLNTKSSDLENIINTFNPLKPDKIILTKLDETTSYGDIINIKENYQLPYSYLTNGQDVPDDILTAESENIFQYLFGDIYE